MRIIFRSRDRIDQRKNVRKGQMLPVFYRALFFYRATNAARFVPCVFFPIPFYLFPRFTVKIMRKSRDRDESGCFFCFLHTQCYNAESSALSGVFQFMDRLFSHQKYRNFHVYKLCK